MVLPHPSIVSDEEGRGLGALTAHQLGGNWGENSARREESKKT